MLHPINRDAMKKLQLSAIRQQVISCLQNNLVESILGLCFFVFFIISDSLPYEESRGWRDMPFMFPTLFVLTYSCHYLFTGKKALIYYLSILSVVPLVLLSDQLKDFTNSSAYGFTLILTLFLLLGFKKTDDNTSFARHSVKLLVNGAFSIAIGLLLIGAVAAIYFSVVYIFDWNSTEDFIEYVAHFTFYLFVPLFFCQLQQEEDTDWENLPHVIQFVLNFILSPGIIIYTAILYIYFLTIAVHWELPKGGVAYMVMAFIIVSMAGRMAQLIVSQRLYDWFYRPFGFIAIPPLVLFWIGTLHRIYTYSLTESRVYLLAAGILMTLYVFFLYSKRLGSYRLMLLISSSVIILLTYIPGISAHNIGIRSQIHRLQRMASELSLWDAATGKLVDTEAFQAKDSLQKYTIRQLDDCYVYLENTLGREAAIARFGVNNLVLEPDNNDESAYFSCPNNDINIEGYNQFLPNCRIIVSKEDKMEVWSKDRLLLEADTQAHFEKYKKEMASWGRNAENIEPFCFRNDSCLVVIDAIVRLENREYKLRDYGDVLVFEK